MKVVKDFLATKKRRKYKTLVENLSKAYKAMGCRMSLEIHFSHSHMEVFPKNLGAVSDEQEERFHQDIKTIERKYQGHWEPAMMGDYCWFLEKEDLTPHKRKKLIKTKPELKKWYKSMLFSYFSVIGLRSDLSLIHI